MPPKQTTKGDGCVGHRAAPISVSWKSGSYCSTLQPLEPYLPADKINLSVQGWHVVPPHGIADRSPGAALFSGPYYFAEQLGFHKVIDTTFMIATMIHGLPDPEDLPKFFRALRRAQRISICARTATCISTRNEFTSASTR